MPKRNDDSVAELKKNPSYREIFDKKSTVIGIFFEISALIKRYLKKKVSFYRLKIRKKHIKILNFTKE